MRILPAGSVPAWLCALAFITAAGLPTGAWTAVTAAPTGAASHDPAVVEHLFALDPDRVSGQEVAEVLARVPAPRIILFQGSFAPVTMAPFAEFLIAMGYPPERIRHPRDGSYSASSFADSRQIAGTLAWYYEADGVRPLAIGHSQGGMMAVRVLHDLAGAFGDVIPVWNPVTDAAEPRTAFIDPLSGASRPVVGFRLPYVAALATGKLARVLLGQWEMLAKLREIPDSVEEFTGFAIEWDLIAGLFPRSDPYLATGSAHVRNVILPAIYTHIGLPETRHLAADPVTRAWIEAYVPDGNMAIPDDPAIDATNLVHAADIWNSVKRHWTLEARRLVAAQHRKVR
jgi:hypothetical protein